MRRQQALHTPNPDPDTLGRVWIRLADGQGLQIDPARAAPDAIVDAIAAAQRRSVSHEQLRSAGLTRSAIAHRVATGRLHRVHRGVYLVGHPDPLPLARETAALLACGAQSALNRQTAASSWRIVDAAPAAIHVLVAGMEPSPGGGVVVHLTRAIDPLDIRRHDGLLLTSPARTLLDLAAVLGTRDARWAVEEARVRRLVTIRDLAEQLERSRGRRGARALRAIVAELGSSPALTRSEAERRLLDLVRAARLPPPKTNVRVEGFEVDAFWPEHRLVVEVDGFAFHASRAAFERDRRRDAALQAAGVRVVRITWRRLADEPEAVVALLRRLLAAAPSA